MNGYALCGLIICKIITFVLKLKYYAVVQRYGVAHNNNLDRPFVYELCCTITKPFVMQTGVLIIINNANKNNLKQIKVHFNYSSANGPLYSTYTRTHRKYLAHTHGTEILIAV